MKDIHICTAADNNFARYTGVMMLSALANAASDEWLHFHILDGGICEEEKKRIAKVCDGHNCKVAYYAFDDADFKDCPLTYLTMTTYYRLKIASVLEKVDKVLYLDGDMIVKESLAPLWETDIADNWAAGVWDVIAEENMKRLGIPENYGYFNAGMMLINLKKWREDEVEAKLYDYLAKYPERLVYQDQDLLNAVIYEKTKFVDLRWNSQFIENTYLQKRDETYFNSLMKPGIIHYIGRDKPWKFDSQVFRREAYIKYFKMSPWYLENKKEYRQQQLKRWKFLCGLWAVYFLKHPLFFLNAKQWKRILRQKFPVLGVKHNWDLVNKKEK